MWPNEVGVETTWVLWDENVPFQVKKIVYKTFTVTRNDVRIWALNVELNKGSKNGSYRNERAKVNVWLDENLQITDVAEKKKDNILRWFGRVDGRNNYNMIKTTSETRVV